jgi:hypothetical protein
MTNTQRNLSVETYRPPQDLVSGVAGGRLVGRNSSGISGLTNRRRWAGCERAVRTEKESIWSLVNTRMGKATAYLMREANSATYEIRMGGISLGVHGTECLDRGAGQHGRSSPAFRQTAGGRQDGSYKGNRKGHTSRKEVRQGNSSDDRWDSKTQQERRPLALAVLKWKEGRGDCR